MSGPRCRPCSAVTAISEAADLFPGGPGLSLDAREQMAARSDFPGESGSGACWLFSLGSWLSEPGLHPDAPTDDLWDPRHVLHLSERQSPHAPKIGLSRAERGLAHSL